METVLWSNNLVPGALFSGFGVGKGKAGEKHTGDEVANPRMQESFSDKKNPFTLLYCLIYNAWLLWPYTENFSFKLYKPQNRKSLL